MRLARALHALGELLITAGVVILLFVAYELWFTGLETAREQRALTREIQTLWRQPAATPSPGATPTVRPVPLGEGLAIIRIPKFADDWARVIVEGTNRADLKKGPGHVEESQLPGEIGNFVVSGHRTTYGAPFNRVDELRPGDPVVIETRDAWYTYRVTETKIVKPTAIEVTWPVPGVEEATPTKALLTLTSCHPEYSARQRIVVHAELTETTRKSTGDLPSALTGA